MAERKKTTPDQAAEIPIRIPSFAVGNDRMRHFARNHWAVKLVALAIDTVPMTVAAIGPAAGRIGMALLIWRFLP